MREEIGDIWDRHAAGYYVGITTNGFVKKSGECVMGRGVALQAKQKFPALPAKLGERIKKEGSITQIFPDWRLFTFPVKHNWWEAADLKLIEKSCEEMVILLMIGAFSPAKRLYLCRPGCGNGRLSWKDVKPIMEKHLDPYDDLVIIDRGE